MAWRAELGWNYSACSVLCLKGRTRMELFCWQYTVLCLENKTGMELFCWQCIMLRGGGRVGYNLCLFPNTKWAPGTREKPCILGNNTLGFRPSPPPYLFTVLHSTVWSVHCSISSQMNGTVLLKKQKNKYWAKNPCCIMQRLTPPLHIAEKSQILSMKKCSEKTNRYVFRVYITSGESDLASALGSREFHDSMLQNVGESHGLKIILWKNSPSALFSAAICYLVA